MVTITFSQGDELAPLYCKYQGQFQPQSAHIEIDPESRFVTAGYSGEIGNAVPMSVYHNRILRLSITAEAKGAAIQQFLSDSDTQALIDRICDGYECVWDGNNHVGRYSEDANSAIEALEETIDAEFGGDSDSVASVWDASEWLAACSLSQNWREGQALSDAVAELEATIEAGVYLDGDLKDALMEQVDSEMGGLDPTEGERLPEYMWADLLAEDAKKYGAYCCPVTETEDDNGH